tara:strand:+ start:50 stop:433 length:384 start_codon:yes stop_codon:yes gene_type:complete
MAKKRNIREADLTKLIKNIVEQELDDEVILDLDDENLDIEAEEYEEETILSPEEIMGLMEEQIMQLQDRIQYSEELLADMLEFTSSLMHDLESNSETTMAFRKSKQKLRALEGRAGREIFWLKSRRL